MKHRDTNIAIFFAGTTMNNADFLTAKELCHRNASQRYDNQWFQSGNLPLKIIVAGVNLHWQWITILRWTALYHVRDKNVRALQANAFEQLFQELPRGTDKWASLSIFMESGAFTDKEYFGMWTAFARDGLCAAFAEITS